MLPPMTLGVFLVWYFSLPGSTRSGEKATKTSLPELVALRQLGNEDLARRARVGRRLEHDEHALVLVRRRSPRWPRR